MTFKSRDKTMALTYFQIFQGKSFSFQTVQTFILVLGYAYAQAIKILVNSETESNVNFRSDEIETKIYDENSDDMNK